MCLYAAYVCLFTRKVVRICSVPDRQQTDREKHIICTRCLELIAASLLSQIDIP